MLFGIDAREIQDGVVTGIGRALFNFLDYFDRQTDEHRCILFAERPVTAVSGERIQQVSSACGNTLYWDQVALPRLIRKHGVNRFYSPYYKVPLTSPVPVLSTIFDLMYIYYPVKWKGTGVLSRWYYRIFGSLMAHKAHAIFTCSEYSKSEITRFYPVSPDKVKVIYLGLSDRYQPSSDRHCIDTVIEKFSITRPFILYTGNFKPHKNVETLIRAFCNIADSLNGTKLVLAGNNIDANFARLQPHIAASKTPDAIVTTGLVSLEEQIALYSSALMYVCPSLYEGFGYPPLEAMACGAPVISSDRTSLGEVVGDAALLCDPLRSDDLAEKMRRLYNDDTLRSTLRKNGLRQAGKFTNDIFCRQFYSLLKTFA
jgi:glycosyltransferase involved in cell wall biosynthesis